MADAGVSEEALEVILRHRGEVAVEETEAGQHGDDREHFRTYDGEARKGFEYAKQNHEACGLGADGKEGGDGCGGALIDIRHPELERCCGDLEAER